MNKKALKRAIEQLDNFLNQGKTAEVIQKVNAILETEHLSPEEAGEMHAFKGWALYRQKNFEEAREEALRAQNTERGLRCLAAIESYLGNLEEAKSYLEKLPDTPAKANARMIGFRDPTDPTPKEEVLTVAVFKYMKV